MKKLAVLLTLAMLLLAFAGCQIANHETKPPAANPTVGKPDPTSQQPTETTPATTALAQPTQMLSQEDAQKVALDHAGFTADSVQFIKVELDRDELVPHYDVEFDKDGFEYSYEIDAYTGKILDTDKDWDD